MNAALSTTITILKLRIGSFIALAALVGIITGGGDMGWSEAAVFTLAVLGASGAAGGFNHYFDRDVDRRMKRTSKRPFATGMLRPGPIWPATFAGLLLASLVMAWSVSDGLATLFVFLGAFTYAIVYTVWLKKRTVWNVVIGGAAGSFALLAGAAAAAPQFQAPIGAVPILLSVVLFLWTPAHFWALAAARSEDYRNAGIPMLPAITGPDTWAPAIFSHVAVLALLSLAPLLFGLGPLYGIFAAAGGYIFLSRSWHLMKAPGPAAAMATFKGSLYHFSLLSLGVVLDGAARWAL